MDLDLNTSDLGLDDLRSTEDGNGNSSSGDDTDKRTTIDKRTTSEFDDFDDSDDCDDSDDSDDSDSEEIISFCRGLDEKNSGKAANIIDENNPGKAASVDENNSGKAASVDENNSGKAGGVDENDSGKAGGVDENDSGKAGGVDENDSGKAASVDENNSGKDLEELPVHDTSHSGPCVDEMGYGQDSEDKDLKIMCDAIEQRLGVGSALQDLEQAYLLYCEYGRLKGFGVRRGEQRYQSQSTEIKWKEYVCCCAGAPDTKRSKRRLPSYKKLVMRTGCRAKIRVSRKLDSPWKVTKFDIEHNHDLLPAEQTYLLRSSRNLSYAQTSILEALHSAGIGVSRACGFMEKESGGFQNLGFIRRDAYDHFVRKGRKSKLENGDSNMLFDYFVKKSDEDPFFYWNAEKDEDGRLMNFFFRDGRSLLDYEAFSEVLSVDTTYSTNKYNLICAPFVGINNHTFTCMFGIGFLSDETTSSFEWLFNEFLKSMRGRQPNVVFTDQCVAMMNAIDKIFTESKHRLCQWHVHRNATKRFGSLNRNSEFRKLWHQCMNEVETEAEFDAVWKQLMTFTNPGGKSQNWFKAMHKLRHRWASVYTRGIFTAGLLSTSRNEGANRCVKAGKRCTDTLIEFVENYEQLKSNWRKREAEENTLGIFMPGQMVSNELFTQAASTYTRTVYQMFENEAMNVWDVKLSHELVDLGDGDVEISATMVSNPRAIKIVYNKNTKYARCTCRMWESEGLLCRHILMVYQFMNNYKIPESQILKRWTKVAKAGCLLEKVRAEKTGTLPNMLYVNTILRRVYDVTCISLDREDCRSIITEKVEELGKEIYDMTGYQQVKTKRKAVSDDNHNFENRAPFTDPKRILDGRFVYARQRRTLDAARKKAMAPAKKVQKATCNTEKGNKEQVPSTPDTNKLKPRATSSVPRIPFQMSEPSSGNRTLYRQHNAGWISHHSKYRALSQP